MNNCSQFCRGPKNTPNGLAAIDLSLRFGSARKIFKDHSSCPLGFTQNPLTKEAAQNLISNGGRHSICQNNPFKWNH